MKWYHGLVKAFKILSKALTRPRDHLVMLRLAFALFCVQARAQGAVPPDGFLSKPLAPKSYGKRQPISSYFSRDPKSKQHDKLEPS